MKIYAVVIFCAAATFVVVQVVIVSLMPERKWEAADPMQALMDGEENQ